MEPSPSVDPDALLTLLVALQFLLTLAVLTLQAWRLSRKEPPLHEVYATKAELRNMEVGLAAKVAKLEGQIEKNAAADEARSAALHERVNLILSAVSRIEGACRAHTKEGIC